MPHKLIREYLEALQEPMNEGIEMTRDMQDAFNHILIEVERLLKELRQYKRGLSSAKDITKTMVALNKEFERYRHSL